MESGWRQIHRAYLMNCPLQSAIVQLSLYTGGTIPVFRKTLVPVKFEGNDWNCHLWCTNHTLSRNWLQKMMLNLGKIFNLQCYKMYSPHWKLCLRTTRIFKHGPGKMKVFRVTIRVLRDAKPIFHKPQSVLYAGISGERVWVPKEMESSYRWKKGNVLSQMFEDLCAIQARGTVFSNQTWTMN